jgi:RNA polymerase sigma factor (sigma-70 family)
VISDRPPTCAFALKAHGVVPSPNRGPLRSVSLVVVGRRRAGEPLGDEALLAGLTVNDPEAATAFVRRFQSKVFGTAFAVTGERHLAEEVAQQAFERAWRHARMYDPRRGPVQAWLLTITRNLAVDHLRARRRRDFEAPDVGEQVASLARGPEMQAVADDASTRLHQAIAHLPPEQSRALLLAAFRGMTAAEVAEAEGIPLGTAKTRLRAAMAKLRASLSDQGVEP